MASTFRPRQPQRTSMPGTRIDYTNLHFLAESGSTYLARQGDLLVWKLIDLLPRLGATSELASWARLSTPSAAHTGSFRKAVESIRNVRGRAYATGRWTLTALVDVFGIGGT